MFQKIDGCTDIDISDINNWLETENNSGCTSLADDKIIALSTTAEIENEDDTDETPLSMMINLKLLVMTDRRFGFGFGFGQFRPKIRVSTKFRFRWKSGRIFGPSRNN